MDKKKKNLVEMRKLGFSQKTLSLMTESQVEMILEKIKRKETKEAVKTDSSKIQFQPDDKLPEDATLKDYEEISNLPDKTLTKVTGTQNNYKPSENKSIADLKKGQQTEGKRKETKEAVKTDSSKIQFQPDDKLPEDATLKDYEEISNLPDKILNRITGTQNNYKPNENKSINDLKKGQQTEGKKTKKKYNPWAVCTASVGRKNKKKFEDCVMGVKKKLKEGRNPYEYLIESKMEEIVENNLSPKMSKGEIMSIIAEKKMKMKKPIGNKYLGKSTVIGGEVAEDTKTAPTKTPSRTTEKEPARRTPHPGRKTGPNPKPKASDSEMESKKSEIITKISNLIDKLSK